MIKEQKVITVRPGERVSGPTKYHEIGNLPPRGYSDF
ncbi:zinc-finger domain-containing protein, partial [Francisella tularensis subsp. holarctica]|nr:zinc-finger domain-containing protein [Francisella tularensis subsp. holarctica]